MSSSGKKITTDLLIEFIELVVHNILYYRKLYPDEIYVKKKKYGLVVNASIHPDLNEYIKNVLTAVYDLLQSEEKNLSEVHLIFHDENETPLENYTLGIQNLKEFNENSDPFLMKTEEFMRNFLLRLSQLETFLKPLPEDSSFTINIVTTTHGYASLLEKVKHQEFPWLVKNNQEEIPNGSIIPIKSIALDFLNVECFVVENKDLKTQ